MPIGYLRIASYIAGPKVNDTVTSVSQWMGKASLYNLQLAVLLHGYTYNC